MKKLLVVIYIVLIINLCACGKKNKDVVEDKLKIANGVEMSIVDDSLNETGIKIIIEEKGKEHYIYDNQYEIEMYSGDKWNKISKKGNDLSKINTSKANSNRQLEYNINWEKIYGKLSRGKYRIIKNVIDEKNMTEKSELFVILEFEIK